MNQTNENKTYDYKFFKDKLKQLIFEGKIQSKEHLGKLFADYANLKGKRPYSTSLSKINKGEIEMPTEFAIWFAEKFGYNVKMIMSEGDYIDDDKQDIETHKPKTEKNLLDAVFDLIVEMREDRKESKTKLDIIISNSTRIEKKIDDGLATQSAQIDILAQEVSVITGKSKEEIYKDLDSASSVSKR